MRAMISIQEQESEKNSKKGGHGKGGWGETNYDQLAKNHSVTDAAEMVVEAVIGESEIVEVPVEEKENAVDSEKTTEQKPLVVNKEKFQEL